MATPANSASSPIVCSSCSVNCSPPGLFGQVQIPERDAAHHHRDAEKRSHRRVPGGKPYECGWAPTSASRSGRGCVISSPSTPRPRGSSPMRCRVSSSIPTVMNRSSSVLDSSVTPSAAYLAPDSSRADSTGAEAQHPDRARKGHRVRPVPRRACPKASTRRHDTAAQEHRPGRTRPSARSREAS